MPVFNSVTGFFEMLLRRRKTSSASVANASNASILQTSINGSAAESHSELNQEMNVKANAPAHQRLMRRPALRDQTNWANKNAEHKFKEAVEKAEAKQRLQAPTMIKRIRFSSMSRQHDTASKLAAAAAAAADGRRRNTTSKIANEAKRWSFGVRNKRLRAHSSNVVPTKAPEEKIILQPTIKEESQVEEAIQQRKSNAEHSTSIDLLVDESSVLASPADANDVFTEGGECVPNVAEKCDQNLNKDQGPNVSSGKGESSTPQKSSSKVSFSELMRRDGSSIDDGADHVVMIPDYTTDMFVYMRELEVILNFN